MQGQDIVDSDSANKQSEPLSYSIGIRKQWICLEMFNMAAKSA